MGRCFGHLEGILMSAPLGSLKRPSRRKPLAACVAVAFALGGASVVHANTFFVSNCAQSGVGSLAAATAAAPGDFVTINITNNSACLHNVNVNGNTVTEVLQLANSTPTFGDGVTINGPGANVFGISGKNAYRALKSTGALTVTDLTVYNGKYLKVGNGTVAYGGCIYGHLGLTLSGVNAFNCYAHQIGSTGGAKGAAFATFLGPVSLTDTNVVQTVAYGSTSARGGAVYSFGDLTMTNSTISGATAHAAGAAATDHVQGGAAFSFGKVTLDSGSIIDAGYAHQTATTGGQASGGGIWADKKVFVHGGSSVVNSIANTQSASLSLGGGIFSSANVATGYIADKATVEANYAYSKTGTARGGGIYSNTGTNAKYSYITQNRAGGPNSRAGGVYAKGGFSSKYSYFWLDTASGGGAVIVPTGSTYMRGTTMKTNNVAFAALDAWSGCNGGGGGDINSTVKVYQSTIAFNGNGTGGAAVYVCANATTFLNNTIAYNRAGSPSVRIKGTGTNPTLTITSNILSGNNYGVAQTLNDLTATGVTISGDHNLIRAPSGGVPGDTIVGQCPLFYPGRFLFEGIQYQYVLRHEVTSPATNAGSNPNSYTTDQRGGGVNSTPPRVSGPPGGPAVADIGSYEIDQSDEIFDQRFEGCEI